MQAFRISISLPTIYYIFILGVKNILLISMFFYIKKNTNFCVCNMVFQ